MIFAGIDPTASEKKPTACALINDRSALISSHLHHTDEQLLEAVNNAWAVGLDAPCSLPLGLNPCCIEDNPLCECVEHGSAKGRKTERDLIKIGIRPYIISKNMFAKGWVRRGLALKNLLEKNGFRVIEVFPIGSKIRLFGNQLPKKTTREGRFALQKKLMSIMNGIPLPDNELYSHDRLDAMLAAYTCYLFWRGETEAIGDPSEGRIILPLETSVDS